jgi:hypothetical protein
MILFGIINPAFIVKTLHLRGLPWFGELYLVGTVGLNSGSGSVMLIYFPNDLYIIRISYKMVLRSSKIPRSGRPSTFLIVFWIQFLSHKIWLRNIPDSQSSFLRIPIDTPYKTWTELVWTGSRLPVDFLCSWTVCWTVKGPMIFMHSESVMYCEKTT